jgi:hypothetical protein
MKWYPHEIRQKKKKKVTAITENKKARAMKR